MSCSVPIRQFLSVPETYRAVPQKQARKRFQKPDPDLELIKRQQYLKTLGYDAELRYDKITRSWFVRYIGNPANPPGWPVDDAVSIWRKAVER